MNWSLVARYAWHGLSQAIITGGGILLALKGWPDSWGWMIVGISSLIALVKGVEGFNATAQ